MGYLEDMKERLKKRFFEIPIVPGPEDDPRDVDTRADGLVWLIGWIDDHPKATREEYLAEMDRVKSEGPGWIPRRPWPEESKGAGQ